MLRQKLFLALSAHWGTTCFSIFGSRIRLTPAHPLSPTCMYA